MGYTDVKGEEYREKMGKLFAEHFSAEERAKINSAYRDERLVLLLNDHLENPGDEKQREPTAS